MQNPKDKKMKYFNFQEFYKSDTAKACGIDNKPPKQKAAEVDRNIMLLVDYVLDPLREKMGHAIYVTSGYRSKELNAKVKGAKKSQHLEGKAADISAIGYEKNEKMAYELLTGDYHYDQLILERTDGNFYHYGWLHVSYNINRNRGQTLVCYRGAYAEVERGEMAAIIKKHLMDQKIKQ